MLIAKSKINDKETGWFVNIRLYDTKKALQRGTNTKGIAGLYRPNGYVIYPKRIVRSLLGTISLCQEYLGAGLISHEVFHASMDYAHKRYNVASVRTSSSERQEDIAYFHGHIVKEICNWLNDKKLWK